MSARMLLLVVPLVVDAGWASEASSEANPDVDQVEVPTVQRLSAEMLTGSVFSDSRTETLIESSDAGDTPASDLIWHESEDRCLQTGVYETGPNRYVVDEPYPYDELMMFVSGTVTLTPSTGTPVVVVPGDTVMLPKGWTGVWDSEGYRKVYVIYDCPEG